jgi:hypothetical protein
METEVEEGTIDDAVIAVVVVVVARGGRGRVILLCLFGIQANTRIKQIS